MATLFFSYSHKDQVLRDELETHLAMLKRDGTIEAWHDRAIPAGNEIDADIDEKMKSADVILLLVSPDFLASRYCYDVEVKLAMARHEAGEARVIPVILRPCDWKTGSFSKLLATPTDGKPITKWANQDDAFLNVIQQIRTALPAKKPTARIFNAPQAARNIGPRSSNLRLKREFSEAESDAFLEESFNFIALFFENSLKELSARHPGIEGRFKRIDAVKFSAAVYKEGKAVARCAVQLGGFHRSSGITYSHDDRTSQNSFNESLSVETGEQSLFLKPLGMAIAAFAQFERNRSLTMQGAAEYYWSMLIQPLQ